MRLHEITKSSAEQLVPVIKMHASMFPSSVHVLTPSQVSLVVEWESFPSFFNFPCFWSLSPPAPSFVGGGGGGGGTFGGGTELLCPSFAFATLGKGCGCGTGETGPSPTGFGS